MNSVIDQDKKAGQTSPQHGYYENENEVFALRAKVLIQNDSKQPQLSPSNSLKTHKKSLAASIIRAEYKLKDPSPDYFKLPDSLILDEDYEYQRFTITKTRDINRISKNREQSLSVKFGLIFGTEEDKNLFKSNFRKEQLYNKRVRIST